MERVLAMRKCEKTSGGGGAVEGLWRGKLASGNFQMENTHSSLSVSFRKKLRGTKTRIENCYCWRDKLNCVLHLLSLLNKDTPCKLLILS